MKKLFLLLFSISLLASLTFAQSGGGAPNPGTPAPSTSAPDKGMSHDSGAPGKKHHHHKHHKKAGSTDAPKPQ